MIEPFSTWINIFWYTALGTGFMVVAILCAVAGLLTVLGPLWMAGSYIYKKRREHGGYVTEATTWEEAERPTPYELERTRGLFSCRSFRGYDSAARKQADAAKEER